MERKQQLFWSIFFGIVLLYSCNHNDEFDIFSKNSRIKEDLRFSLQFTNAENVDLDLYVQTPNGSIFFYGNLSAEGGIMQTECTEMDCLFDSQESVFWTNQTAPSGVYKYWIEYYGSENTENNSSDYTVTVIANNEIIANQTGTLKKGISSTWSFEFKND